MKKGILSLAGLAFLMFAGASSAAGLADLADNIREQFGSFLELAVAFSYIAGFIILVVAIFKFKQHSDDPRQTPMKTPAMLMIVAALLLGAPTLLGATAGSIFGGSSDTTSIDGAGAESIRIR